MNTAVSTLKNAPLSDVKRELLTKFLRGHVLQRGRNPFSIGKRAYGIPVPLSLAQEQIWRSKGAPGIAAAVNELLAKSGQIASVAPMTRDSYGAASGD